MASLQHPRLKTIHASQQDRPDVAENRTRWAAEQPRLDARRLIFIDETWAKTNMTHLRGRSQRGERLLAKVPHGHWKTTTLIAALGVGRITASAVVDGPVNAGIFDAFVENVLVPTLPPGDVVVLDNLSSHKRHRTRELIEAAGARLAFLPPHSPDLNPIENIFAKARQLLRPISARTRDALWDAMQGILSRISNSDALHCLQHCNYTPQLQ